MAVTDELIKGLVKVKDYVGIEYVGWLVDKRDTDPYNRCTLRDAYQIIEVGNPEDNTTKILGRKFFPGEKELFGVTCYIPCSDETIIRLKEIRELRQVSWLEDWSEGGKEELWAVN